MRREGKLLRALVCTLALLANGAGALAQEQGHQEAEKRAAEQRAQEVQIEKERVMINPMAGAGISSGGGGGIVVGAQGGFGISFVASEMAFDNKVIKGAPFSADAVNESVQVLGDGNRITRTTTSKLYRDSEGRTRREQTLTGVGGLATTGETPQTIFINDPTVGTNYVLNTRDHVALKATQFSFKREGGDPSGAKTEGNYTFMRNQSEGTAVISGGRINSKAQKRVQPTYPAVARAAGAQGGVDVEVVVDEQGNVASAKAVSGPELLRDASVEAARQWTFNPTLLQGKPVKVKGTISFEFAMSSSEGGTTTVVNASPQSLPKSSSGAMVSAGPVLMRERAPGDNKVLPNFAEAHESLGKQSFDGVEADGTRTTVTIPAGAMGNERPILIVSERWYSAELQTVLMTKHSDPRFGETTYRLTNISRNEPDHSLFEVPAGFAITEGRAGMERMMMSLPRKQQQ